MSMVTTQPQQRPRLEVIDANPMMDTGRFEHMARLAGTIERSGLVPDSIAFTGTGNAVERLPNDVVQARVFLVTNQAIRWGMDVFAVLQSTSVVRGKLCYEGKLVAAVLDAKLGVALDYVWDDKTNDAAGITVTGTLPDGRVRSITGTVADWKTSGAGSPWGTPQKNRRMLAYRGAREWVRMWAPAVLLGVYTADELDDLQEAARETRRSRLTPPTPSLPGIATAVIEHQAAPADVALKVNTDTPAEEKSQPPKDAGKKAPPLPTGEVKVDQAAPTEQQPKKAPPIPPTNKAKAASQQPAEDTDQTDWTAELEAFSNAVGSAESAEEVDEAKQAHEHLFSITTPIEVGKEADKIVAAELERIGRQG